LIQNSTSSLIDSSSRISSSNDDISSSTTTRTAQCEKTYQQSLNTSVLNVISTSISSISGVEQIKSRYLELVIFKEDSQVPISTVCDLWKETSSMSNQQSIQYLDLMVSRSLIFSNEQKTMIYLHVNENTCLSFVCLLLTNCFEKCNF